MRTFLAGFATVQLAVLAAAEMGARAHWLVGPRHHVQLALVLLVLPVASAWAVLTVVHGLEPRRILLREPPAALRLLLLGGTAAVLAFGMSAIGLVWTSGSPGEWGVIAGGAALGTLGVARLLPRRRAGRCSFCDHDLRGLPPQRAGRCPECGREDPAGPQATPVGPRDAQPAHGPQ